jgi:hypothetical protein
MSAAMASADSIAADLNVILILLLTGHPRYARERRAPRLRRDKSSLFFVFGLVDFPFGEPFIENVESSPWRKVQWLASVPPWAVSAHHRDHYEQKDRKT